MSVSRDVARPPGARLGQRDVPAALAQQIADHRLELPAVDADDVVAHHLGDLMTAASSAAARLRRVSRLRQQVQLDLAQPGENRRFDRRRLIEPAANRSAAPSPRPRDSPWPDTRIRRRCNRTAPARGASRARTSPSIIGFISRGGPGSNAIAAPPCSSHRPGAVPFGLASTVAPRGTSAWRRLTAGIFQPRVANRRSIASTIAGIFIHREPQVFGHHLSREVVVGRPETAGEDHDAMPRQRMSDMRGQVGAVVADNRLVRHGDAQVVQDLRDEQRIGVDLVRGSAARCRRR